MNRATRDLMRYGATLLLALATLYACTTVDLCYEDYHPHRSAITAHFNWGPYADEAPAEMNLIANRLYNTWRNHGIVETESGYCRQGLIPTDEVGIIKEPENKPEDDNPTGGDNNTTGGDNNTTGGDNNTTGGDNNTTGGDNNTTGGDNNTTGGDNNTTGGDNNTTGGDNNTTGGDTDPEQPEKEDEKPNIPFKVRPGEYNFMAINAYEGLSIDNLQRYLDEKALTSDSLFFHLEETPREKLAELEGLDMPDFNPKYRYVHNPGRLFYGTSEGVKVQTGEDKEIEFTPTVISKQVTVKFNVRTIGDIQVEKLIAEMSGICGRFNITENYLDTANLYRLLFIPEEESVQQVPDEPSQHIHTYSATFHIMGLVPSYRSTYLIGPGILQVAVYAATEGKRRIFYAGANPRKDLVEARILRTENGKTYLRDTEPITIILSGELVIDAQHILNRDDGRFDIWFSSDEEFIDVDV